MDAIDRPELGFDAEKWAIEMELAFEDFEDGHVTLTPEDYTEFFKAWLLGAMRAAIGSEMMQHWKADPVGAMRAQAGNKGVGT